MKKLTKKITAKYLPIIVGKYLNTVGIVAPNYAAKRALDIFCTPRKGKILPYHEKLLSDGKYEVLSYEGQHIQTYRWKGKGPKILLCHGWESNSWRWRKLLAFLKTTDLDIYALDAPGHGASGSKYFNGVLYANFINIVCQKINPAVAIGHSIGAFSLLMSVADHQPTSISKIIALGPPDKLSDITDQYFNIIGLNTKVQKAYLNQIPKIFGHKNEYFSSSNFVQKISQKGLLIHDKNDPTNPYSDSLSINKSWNKSNIYTTEGLGHALQSKEVYEVISDFIFG